MARWVATVRKCGARHCPNEVTVWPATNPRRYCSNACRSTESERQHREAFGVCKSWYYRRRKRLAKAKARAG